jgi:hypothetical protein
MPGKSKARQIVEQELREAAQIALGTVQSRYMKAFDRRAHGYALLGHTNAEIAELLGIDADTFNAWAVEHPSLNKALHSARYDAHVALVKAMHRNAKGFRHRETKLHVVGGEVKKTEITKAYAPNQQAAQFLLTNRLGAQWQDRKAVEHSGNVSLSALLADLHKEPPKAIDAQLIEQDPEPEDAA